jgi:hypothetical protein
VDYRSIHWVKAEIGIEIPGEPVQDAAGYGR